MRYQSYKFLLFLLCFAGFSASAQQINQVPEILIREAKVSPFGLGNTIQVRYDLSDPDDTNIEIRVALSDDGGLTYLYENTLASFSGDYGFPVPVGTGKMLEIILTEAPSKPLQVRLIALDRQPLEIPYLVSLVDSADLRAQLQFVEGIRHRSTGATHLQAVRDSMVRHFDDLRLRITRQPVPFGAYTGENIIGTNFGMAQAVENVIVDAHYDSVENSPGADDNGSGTVGMMTLAKILARFPSEKTIRYIGFDLEETGLVGSSAYVSSLPASEITAGVLNFEMIGYYNETPNSQELPAGFNLLFPAAYNAVVQDSFRGNFITNVGNANSESLTNLFSGIASQYVPDLKVINVVVPGNGAIAPDLRRSDHAPFWVANRPALMITDGANFRNECYHTPDDKIYKLNLGFMQQVSQATLATVATLAETQHGSWAAAEVVNPSLGFFDPSINTCGLKVWLEASRPTVNIRVPETCQELKGNSRIEILSTDGKLLFSSKINLFAGQQQAISVPEIQGSQSIHFARIFQENGKMVWSGAVR